MTAGWAYHNPVDIRFGGDAIEITAALLGGARYALVTYPEPAFKALGDRLAAAAGRAAIVVDDVMPNPDCRALDVQTERLWALAEPVDVIVAVGGGSVIDTAKVLAAGRAGFAAVLEFVTTGAGDIRPTPLLAVPTTSGTGSEVTCWATIWDEVAGKKYSLAHPELYPRTAIVDPDLMLEKPAGLTLATGLDALSHALESIWNKNANPVSARHAVFAAKTIRAVLPRVLAAPGDRALRAQMAEAALTAGLAFSNTKTAIAHNLSYPVTLGYNVPHGIACSFTLPTVLRAVATIDGFRRAALVDIFGADLARGADALSRELADLGVGTAFSDYGVDAAAAGTIIEEAFVGQRGRNFIGEIETFKSAARADGLFG